MAAALGARAGLETYDQTWGQMVRPAGARAKINIEAYRDDAGRHLADPMGAWAGLARDEVTSLSLFDNAGSFGARLNTGGMLPLPILNTPAFRPKTDLIGTAIALLVGRCTSFPVLPSVETALSGCGR